MVSHGKFCLSFCLKKSNLFCVWIEMYVATACLFLAYCVGGETTTGDPKKLIDSRLNPLIEARSIAEPVACFFFFSAKFVANQPQGSSSLFPPWC